jgi:hypothetical protein
MGLTGMKYEFSGNFYHELTFVDKTEGLPPWGFEMKLYIFLNP